MDAVAASIREFGFKVPIITDKDGVIIAGHTRLKAAEKLGLKTVPVIVASDLTEEQAKALRLADNKTAELAEWDPDLLLKELSEMGGGIDMQAFGFEPLPDNIDDIVEDEYTEPDDLPSRAKRGDVFVLGEHTLMCGSATEAADVEKLMHGIKADLLQTDPPYGVSLGMVGKCPEDRAAAKARHRRTDGLAIENDGLQGDELKAFLLAAFKIAREALKPGGVFYIWHADTNGVVFRETAAAAGLAPHQVLVWVKSLFSLGRSDYQWRHEPCLYGWRDGAAHYFINSRNESTVYEDMPNFNKMSKSEAISRLRSFYEGQEPTTIIHDIKPGASKLHPTMKPVTLIAYQIANSTRRGETVLDVFGGSGTTMIACEQLKRKCRMMELDPHYCDVIIDRWEKFTNKKAEKL